MESQTFDDQGSKSATPRARIEIDWEGLAVAFENQLPESHSFLDLKSGKVHTSVTNSPGIPDPPGLAQDYLYVPPRPSREGYRTMQHFLEKIEDPILKDKLTATLVGKGAFRRFKDALLEFPEIRQQWFAFKDAEVYTYIREWLARELVEATNQPPPSTSKERIPIGRPRPPEGWRPSTGMVQTAGHSGNWLEVIAPYDRHGLIYRPARTALLVIDMQRVFVDPKGSSFLPMSEAMGERLWSLVEKFRAANLPVIFSRHVHHQPREDGGSLGRWWKTLILESEWESELMPPFIPRPGERVIQKCRYSAFAGTPLLWVLRSLKVEDVVIGGVMSNLCCECTARDAFINDFNVFFLGDGTCSSDEELHVSTLRNIAYGFGKVLGVAEAIETLRGSVNVGALEFRDDAKP